MASRFIDTEIWSEDWFCELGGEYQNFWNYICARCDNAGVWKPNKIDFEIKSRSKISLDSFLQKVNENGGKERILITKSGRWFITGFIAFQWFNKKDSFGLVLSNKLHLHIWELLKKNGIPIEKVRGLREVLETSKVKDKVMGKVNNGVKSFEELGYPDEKYFVIINSKYPNDPKYRLWGVDGVTQFLEMNGSKWPRADLAEKFLRDKTGQPFNDFGHLLNAYNMFIKNQFK